MIYDGTIAHENGEANDDRIIGTSAFNEQSNDNAYVGYMYGTPNSSTYEETHANINDSTIKMYIDSWYENNLKNTEYEKHLIDNIFCNDRSISEGIPAGYNNTGIKNNKTAYRWYYGPWSLENYNSTAKLKCIKRNDAFTVNEISNGNGALKYQIGLLSTDEIVLAGGWYESDGVYYLNTGQKWWGLSADSINQYGVYIRRVGIKGNVDNLNDGLVSNNYGVRSVLSISSNSLKSGDGTINNPYTVE